MLEWSALLQLLWKLHGAGGGGGGGGGLNRSMLRRFLSRIKAARATIIITTAAITPYVQDVTMELVEVGLFVGRDEEVIELGCGVNEGGAVGMLPEVANDPDSTSRE